MIVLCTNDHAFVDSAPLLFLVHHIDNDKNASMSVTFALRRNRTTPIQLPQARRAYSAPTSRRFANVTSLSAFMQCSILALPPQAPAGFVLRMVKARGLGRKRHIGLL